MASTGRHTSLSKRDSQQRVDRRARPRGPLGSWRITPSQPELLLDAADEGRVVEGRPVGQVLLGVLAGRVAQPVGVGGDRLVDDPATTLGGDAWSATFLNAARGARPRPGTQSRLGTNRGSKLTRVRAREERVVDADDAVGYAHQLPPRKIEDQENTMAEDATRVAPHVYKVVFENERARVLEVTMQPGDRSDMHSHPDYFFYLLGDGGRVRFTMPSGETAELELPAGASMWREAEAHATENIGGTTIRALFFEPK